MHVAAISICQKVTSRYVNEVTQEEMYKEENRGPRIEPGNTSM